MTWMENQGLCPRNLTHTTMSTATFIMALKIRKKRCTLVSCVDYVIQKWKVKENSEQYKRTLDSIRSEQEKLSREWDPNILLWHRMKSKWSIDEDKVALDFAICVKKDGSFVVMKTLSFELSKSGKTEQGTFDKREFDQFKIFYKNIKRGISLAKVKISKLEESCSTPELDSDMDDHDVVWQSEILILSVPSSLTIKVTPVSPEIDAVESCATENNKHSFLSNIKNALGTSVGTTTHTDWKHNLLQLLETNRRTAKVLAPYEYFRSVDNFTLDPAMHGNMKQ